MMEYCYESVEGLLCRIDRKSNIYEAFNWKEKKWEYSKEAFQIVHWYCEHLSNRITEEQATRLANGEEWKNVRTGEEKVFTAK